MKEKPPIIKIFPLSTQLVFTELLSIAGDKYRHALPFQWEITRDFNSANIVVWDGIETLKNQKIVQKVLGSLSAKKILLLVDGSSTIHRGQFSAGVVKPEKVPHIELRGWNILPEELLSAIEACQKKLEHV
jgi:hypothetical protein